MSDFHETLWCAGCGTEILYSPYVLNRKNYCCQDCAFGYTCECSRAMEREDDYRNAVLPQDEAYQGN
jgi:hypothetical protein